MKIGIIVYGPLRQFDIASKTWGLFKNLNSDFYFSTWETSEQYHLDYNINLIEKFDGTYIKNYIPNSVIKIHDESKFVTCVEGKYNINIDKMIFHWKSGLEMIKNSKKLYDILILLRPDLYIDYHLPDESLFNYNKPRTIYGMSNIKITSINQNNGEYDYFVNDVFLMGNYEVMSNLITNSNNNFGSSIHTNLAKKILELRYFVDLIPTMKVVPIRPISRRYNDLGVIDVDYYSVEKDHIDYNKNYKL